MVQRVLGQVTSASDLAFGGHASSVGARAAEHSRVVEWRCSSQYQNTGLYPVIDFFERFLAFLPREPAESRLERLVQHLDGYGLAAPEVVPLFASLLSLEHVEQMPTLNLSPFRQREETWSFSGSGCADMLVVSRSCSWSRICTGRMPRRWNFSDSSSRKNRTSACSRC